MSENSKEYTLIQYMFSCAMWAMYFMFVFPFKVVVFPFKFMFRASLVIRATKHKFKGVIKRIKSIREKRAEGKSLKVYFAVQGLDHKKKIDENKTYQLSMVSDDNAWSISLLGRDVDSYEKVVGYKEYMLEKVGKAEDKLIFDDPKHFGIDTYNCVVFHDAIINKKPLTVEEILERMGSADTKEEMTKLLDLVKGLEATELKSFLDIINED